MKNMKKVLSLAIVFALVLSLSAVAGAGTFVDVTPETKYADAIERLATLEILGGRGAGVFDPEGNITRAEFAKIVYIVYNGTDDKDANLYKGISQFTDVAADAWYAGYVNWAANTGIVNGMGDGTFAPDKNVKVAEAVKMLVVAITGENSLAYPFGYISRATALGLFQGVTVQGVEQYASRALVAQFANAALSMQSALLLEWNGTYDGNGNAIYVRKSPLVKIFKLADETMQFQGSTNKNILANITAANKVRLDGTDYTYTGDTTGFDFMDVKVYFIDKDANGDLDTTDEIISIVPTGKSITTTQDKITKSGNDFKVNGTTTKFASTITVYEQGADGLYTSATGSIDSYDGLLKDEVVKIIDNDSNGTYDILVIDYIKNAAVVTSYSTITNRISMTGASNIETKNVVAYSGIAKDHVVDYTVSRVKGVTIYTVNPSATVKGATITSISSNGTTVTIGGKTYRRAADATAFPNATSLLGAVVDLVIDTVGNIVNYAEVSSVATDTGVNIGVITKISKSSSIPPVYTVDVKMGDGSELKGLELASTAVLKDRDGDEISLSSGTFANDWFDSSATDTGSVVVSGGAAAIVGEVVYFEFNTANKISKISSVVNIADADTASVEYEIAGAAAGALRWSSTDKFFSVYSGSTFIGGYAASSALVGIKFASDVNNYAYYTVNSLPSFNNTAVEVILRTENGTTQVIALFVDGAFDSVSDSNVLFGILNSYTIEVGATAGKVRYNINGNFGGTATTMYSVDMVSSSLFTLPAAKDVVNWQLTDGAISGVAGRYYIDNDAEIDVTEYTGNDKFYHVGIVSNTIGSFYMIKDVGNVQSSVVGQAPVQSIGAGSYFTADANTKVKVVSEAFQGTIADTTATTQLKVTYNKIANGTMADLIVTDMATTGEIAYLVLYSTKTVDGVENILDEVIIYTTPVMIKY